MQGLGETKVAVLLADVQMLERGRRDTVGHARAGCSELPHQGRHPARVFRRAAVVVRTLPEPAYPAGDGGGTALEVGEIRLVDQRAVAEQPDAVAATEVVAVTVEGGGVVRHGRAGTVHGGRRPLCR